jgi:hypothetical protein
MDKIRISKITASAISIVFLFLAIRSGIINMLVYSISPKGLRVRIPPASTNRTE